jgi:hypothetical protein
MVVLASPPIFSPAHWKARSIFLVKFIVVGSLQNATEQTVAWKGTGRLRYVPQLAATGSFWSSCVEGCQLPCWLTNLSNLAWWLGAILCCNERRSSMRHWHVCSQGSNLVDLFAQFMENTDQGEQKINRETTRLVSGASKPDMSTSVRASKGGNGVRARLASLGLRNSSNG